MFTDRVLTCRECGAQFTWSSEEQQFYELSGLRHAPRRCRGCRHRRKAAASAEEPAQPPETSRRPPKDPRPMYAARCSECRQETSVPFPPDPARAAFCADCFRRRRALVGGTP